MYTAKWALSRMKRANKKINKEHNKKAREGCLREKFLIVKAIRLSAKEGLSCVVIDFHYPKQNIPFVEELGYDVIHHVLNQYIISWKEDE